MNSQDALFHVKVWATMAESYVHDSLAGIACERYSTNHDVKITFEYYPEYSTVHPVHWSPEGRVQRNTLDEVAIRIRFP